MNKILPPASGAISFRLKGQYMEEPGLDKRHRDQDGEIDQKHGNTLNKNLPEGPIPQFPPETTLQEMRDKTGEVSIDKVREAAKIQK